jgi:hypothetical protein
MFDLLCGKGKIFKDGEGKSLMEVVREHEV